MVAKFRPHVQPPETLVTLSGLRAVLALALSQRGVVLTDCDGERVYVSADGRKVLAVGYDGVIEVKAGLGTIVLGLIQAAEQVIRTERKLLAADGF